MWRTLQARQCAPSRARKGARGWLLPLLLPSSARHPAVEPLVVTELPAPGFPEATPSPLMSVAPGGADLFRVASGRALYAELPGLGFARVKIPASSVGPVREHLEGDDRLGALCRGYCELLTCDQPPSPRNLCRQLADGIIEESAAPDPSVQICPS